MAEQQMTLSQAMRKIAKLKGQLTEFEKRAASSVVWAEGSEPAYTFASAVEQAEGVRKELVRLATLRALTNAKTVVEYAGKTLTLTEAVLTLAELKGQIAWHKGLRVGAHEEISAKADEYQDGKMVTVSKKVFCAFPEAKRQTEVEKLQEEFDRLNDVVETTLHKTLLVKG